MSSGSFPFAVTGWVGSTGFFGPKRVAAAAASTTVIVTAANCLAGDTVGSVNMGYLGAGRPNFAQHGIITPDPGVDVGSIAPASVGGFPIAGCVIGKQGSPFVSYIIFVGSFNLVGKTVSYKDPSSTVVTAQLNVANLAALGLGAGFTAYTVSTTGGQWGFFNGIVNPLTLTFNF